MIPLAMIVLDELRDDVPGVPRTDWNDAIETLFLDRQSPRPSKKGRRLGAAGSELRAMPFEQQTTQAGLHIAVDLHEFDRRIPRTKVGAPAAHTRLRSAMMLRKSSWHRPRDVSSRTRARI